jgi:hypothetical protein
MVQRRDMSVYELAALMREARALRSQALRDLVKSLFSRKKSAPSAWAVEPRRTVGARA